jgi:hypothetical protein
MSLKLIDDWWNACIAQQIIQRLGVEVRHANLSSETAEINRQRNNPENNKQKETKEVKERIKK